MGCGPVVRGLAAGPRPPTEFGVRPGQTPARARAARELIVLLDGWSPWNAAELLRVHQRTISRLRAGQLDRHSLEQLLRQLHRLGRAVALTARQREVGCPGIDRGGRGVRRRVMGDGL